MVGLEIGEFASFMTVLVQVTGVGGRRPGFEMECGVACLAAAAGSQGS